ncbi:hypothetical protein BVY04_00495 [bacterium M21]|nr:hypothetical protein BVY04_00495 [bacterium M21]
MANQEPIFLGTVEGWITKFENTDSDTVKDIFTPGTEGGAIKLLLVRSTSSVAEIINISMSTATEDVLLAAVTVPAGELVNVMVDDVVFSAFRNDDLVIEIPLGMKLRAGAAADITDGAVQIIANGGSY